MRIRDLDLHVVRAGRVVGERGINGGRVTEVAIPIEVPVVAQQVAFRVARSRGVELDVERGMSAGGCGGGRRDRRAISPTGRDLLNRPAVEVRVVERPSG